VEQGAGIARTAEALDEALTGPVLVVGSLPPAGRDLDLLARSAQLDETVRHLRERGFVAWRRTWVRFADTGNDVVDLSEAGSWRTATFDPARLWEDAEPIDGYRHLVRPAPATVLLLAARGMVTRRGRITAKVRRRVEGALERDPGAWQAARALGLDAGMAGALELLRVAYEAEGRLSPRQRAAGLAGVLLEAGPVPAKLRVLGNVRPRRVRPAVVSFSGLDGSGKSTQVSAAVETLTTVGVTAAPQWAGFKTATRIRLALPWLDRNTAPEDRDRLVPAACLAHPVARRLWLSTVVVANVVSLWRFVLRGRQGQQVVVFDRFTPDTAVKLDLHYACRRGFDVGFERALFKALAPKPDVGFLVEVPSEVAYSRRQDQTPEELALMARLYDDQAQRFGLVRLDGTRHPDDLRAEVRRLIWDALP
jgi:thymidylate kinase